MGDEYWNSSSKKQSKIFDSDDDNILDVSRMRRNSLFALLIISHEIQPSRSPLAL